MPCLFLKLTIESTMGLSRRFLNLIVDNRFPGAVSLLSIDLRRHKLFNTTTPADLPLINRSVSESERPPCVANANNHQKKRKKKTVKMRMLHLPAPTIDLEASSRGYSWNIKCSPLTDRKLLCTDNYGRHVLFDSEARQVEDLPFLNEPKNSTFSIFIPGAATDTNGCDDNGGGGSSIYIMERCPSHEQEQRLLSGQFEAFVHGRHTPGTANYCLHRHSSTTPSTSDPRSAHMQCLLTTVADHTSAFQWIMLAPNAWTQ